MNRLLLSLPIVGIMFGFGLGMPFGEILRGMRRTGLLARGVLVSMILVPAAALLLARLFDLPTIPASALMLVSVAAGPLLIPVPVSVAKGDVVYAFDLALVIGVLTVFAAPATTNFLTGAM